MSVLGSCDKSITWTYDADGNICVNIPNCVTCEDLKIPAQAEDQFTTCEISEDGKSVALTIPGKATPLVLKLDALQGAVTVASDGTQTPLEVVDCVLQIPEAEQICWGINAEGCPVIGIPNCITGEELVIGSVQTVTGNVVDNADPKNPVITAVASVSGEGVDNTDPLNPIINVPPVSTFSQDPDTGVITHTAGDGTEVIAQTKHSTTEAAPEGFHTITTDDGVSTAVCLEPVKEVLDSEGNSIVADGVATLPEVPSSTTVPEPDGFHTITTDDGVSTAVCLTPVKSINGAEPDINGNVNVADLFSNTTDNGDGTYTTVNSDGSEVTWSGDTFASGADNDDGTATVTFSDGSTLTFCLNPVKAVEQNADNTGATVTLADGTTNALDYPSPTVIPDESITVLSQDEASGEITYIDENGDTATAQTKFSTRTNNEDFSLYTITTDDGRPTVVCRLQYKGLRDNEDGTFTEEFAAQNGSIVEGETIDFSDDCICLRHFNTPAEPEVIGPDGETWFNPDLSCLFVLENGVWISGQTT